jgi:hypothetical protein
MIQLCHTWVHTQTHQSQHTTETPACCVHYSSIHDSHITESAQVPSWEEGQMKQMWYTYTTEFYSAIKNRIMSLAGQWTELEFTALHEISQTQMSHTWTLCTCENS